MGAQRRGLFIGLVLHEIWSRYALHGEECAPARQEVRKQSPEQNPKIVGAKRRAFHDPERLESEGEMNVPGEAPHLDAKRTTAGALAAPQKKTTDPTNKRGLSDDRTSFTLHRRPL
jgi:hypothetical protein